MTLPVQSLVPASMVMGMPMIVGAHTEDEVNLALAWASDTVESYCERKFAYCASDTVNVDPHRGNGGKPQARLPNPPVWNVSTVLAEMRVGQGLSWVELVYYQWTSDGLLYDTSQYYGYNGVTGQDFWSGGPTGEWAGPPNWPFLPSSLQVSYSHGYTLPGDTAVSGVDPLPSAVISAVVKGASFFLDNPNGAMELRIGELTSRFSEQTSGPAGFLDEKLLGAYRLVHL